MEYFLGCVVFRFRYYTVHLFVTCPLLDEEVAVVVCCYCS